MLPDFGCLAFGPYLVEKEIGSGGMGIVYRARHESTGQPVALKSVRLRSSELLTSFRREVHALAMVRHPGIVRIIDHGVTEKNPWYAMELIDGQSLSQHLAQLRSGTPPIPGTVSASSSPIERSRLIGDLEHWWEMPWPSSRRAAPVSPGDCVPVLRGICRTLSFLHGRGLVHRDLKPDNILIRDGTAVLVDFGLVVQFSGAIGREVLELADVAGTFAYMAPEQRFGRFVDARADLFSLGCVMYEWFTGLLPFGAGGLGTTMARRPLSPSELNPDVPPALDALVMRLITKDPTERLGYADDVDAVLAELEGSEPNEPSPRTFYLYRSALAGRKQVLRRLEQALEGALTGRPRIILVTGESGCGKTRLVVELAARGADRGMQVVPGECVPVVAGAGEVGGGLGAPFHPFRQFLHAVVDACRAGGSARARQLLGERAALLVAYEPSLAEFVDVGPGPLMALPAQTARARLFECLKELIVDYARGGPALLVLDDLQWADDLSLEFLSHLAESTTATDAAFVLVGTCRLEEMGARLRALAENPGISVESLPLFDHVAVREMVSGMLALPEPPASLINFVNEESRGNPFFIAEYLRAAIEAGLLRRDVMGRWHLSPSVTEAGELRQRVAAPPTISAVVALRLRDLEPASIDILRAAAVLGREFDVELVARTAGLATAVVLDAYAALRPRNILEEDGAGVSRFAHDKLREITYAETAAEQRVELHARAAAALEDRYAGRDAAPHFGELGFHHARAGVCARAADYYQRAGEQAQEAYANEDAIRFFRLALEQTEDTEDTEDALGNDGLRTRLREQLADGLMVVGRPAEAGEIFEAGMDSLPNAFEPHDRARWRRKLAQTWERQHRHIEALENYALAEHALGTTADRPGAEKQWWHEFVQLQVDRAWSLYFLARVDELTALVERVRPAVLAHASPIQVAKFLEWQVLGAAKRDRLRISDETLEHTRILLEAGEACGEARGVANARFMRGFVFLMRGDVEEAEPFFVNAIEVAERLGDALLRTRFISYYAIVLRRLARLTEAHATAEGLLTFAQERSMFDYVGVARATLAWCAWREGVYEDVERHADEALAAWDRLRPAYIYPLQWLALMPLAARWQRAGRTAEALEHWRRVLEDPQQRLAPSLEAAIEAALSRGDAASAAAVVDEAIRQRYL